MPRDHAKVKLAIWDDEDFRALSPAAQHLYFVLLTSLKLDFAGVTDWRPGRIAAHARGWTEVDVERAAEELSERRFIVIDEATEEVLLRSFIRHDGIMQQPNLAVAMKKAYMAVASATLRAVIVHELLRLHKSAPDLNGWARVSDMLDKPSLDPSANPSFRASLDPSLDPSGTAHPNGSVDPSGKTCLTTAPSTSTYTSTEVPNGTSGPRKRGTRLPDDWQPDEQLIAWQREHGISAALARRELPRFRDYWSAVSGDRGVKLDWDATWRNWLRREQEREAPGTAASSASPHANPWDN